MRIRDWRDTQKPRWSLERTARALTVILGEKVGTRTLHRYETGETQAPTLLMEAVVKLTGGLVAPADWHAVRLQYLRSQPDCRVVMERLMAVAAE